MLRTDEILSTIQMLHGEHLDVRSVHLRHAVTRGHFPCEVPADLGDGDHLAVRQRRVVLQVRTLTHLADADETNPEFACHASSLAGRV